jgi:methylated-DNA-[protein]-cysteine S-methyltransferase
MTHYSILNTAAIGDLLLMTDGSLLTGVYFMGREHAPTVPPAWRRNPSHPVLALAAEQIPAYLAGQRTDFTVPLAESGTTFQREIWRQIALIPFGQTITYTELARRAGNPRAVRAAGTATGLNPLSIVVPCHRVIGEDGTPRGYAGGLDRKQRLLALEKSWPLGKK